MSSNNDNKEPTFIAVTRSMRKIFLDADADHPLYDGLTDEDQKDAYVFHKMYLSGPYGEEGTITDQDGKDITEEHRRIMNSHYNKISPDNRDSFVDSEAHFSLKNI